MGRWSSSSHIWDEHLFLTEMKTKFGAAAAATKPSDISDRQASQTVRHLRPSLHLYMASILKAKGATLNTLFSAKFRGEGNRSESLPHCWVSTQGLGLDLMTTQGSQEIQVFM